MILTLCFGVLTLVDASHSSSDEGVDLCDPQLTWRVGYSPPDQADHLPPNFPDSGKWILQRNCARIGYLPKFGERVCIKERDVGIMPETDEHSWSATTVTEAGQEITLNLTRIDSTRGHFVYSDNIISDQRGHHHDVKLETPLYWRFTMSVRGQQRPCYLSLYYDQEALPTSGPSRWFLYNYTGNARYHSPVTLHLTFEDAKLANQEFLLREHLQQVPPIDGHGYLSNTAEAGPSELDPKFIDATFHGAGYR